MLSTYLFVKMNRFRKKIFCTLCTCLQASKAGLISYKLEDLTNTVNSISESAINRNLIFCTSIIPFGHEAASLSSQLTQGHLSQDRAIACH